MKKLFVCMAIFLWSVLTFSTTAQTDDDNIWYLRRFDQDGQITLYDGPPGASTTGKPVEMGDFNGNGCGDVAITGQNARGAAGQVRVVFDVCDHWGSAFNLFEEDPNRPMMVNMYGAQPGDMFGTELHHADFNNDGFDDLLIGAQNIMSPDFTISGVGAAYLVFGSADFASMDTLDMLNPPANVLRIFGTDYQDRLGMWVEGGDFDGDGFHDTIVGANQADGLANARSNSGEVYIFYGSADMFATYGNTLVLSETTENVTRILGADFDDLLGSTVYGADLNQDGIDDAIMSAAIWRGSAGVGGLAQGGGDGPGNTRYNAGDTYVLFGSENLRGKTIDLQTLLDSVGKPINASLSVVYGPEGSDYMGEEIVVGDLNGDGWNELVVGSLATPGRDNIRIDGGEAWVIDGSENFAGKMFDLAAAGSGIAVYAPEGDNKGGDTMLIADMNGDSIGDLLYGMPNANAYDERGAVMENAGVLAVLYGTEDGFSTTEGFIDLASPPSDLQIDFLYGVDPYDMSAYGMALYDLDNDGWLDIAMNGMNGDGFSNRITDGGEIYIISGKEFAEYMGEPHTLSALPTRVPDAIAASSTPTIEPTPYLTQTPNPNVTPLPIGAGETLYNLSCAGCHGLQGEGLEGIAVPLANSDFVDSLNDTDLLVFIRMGRTATHPDSKIGRPMPASGGNPTLTDAEILAIISHIRGLE